VSASTATLSADGIDVRKRSNKNLKNVKERKNVTKIKDVCKRNKNVTSS